MNRLSKISTRIFFNLINLIVPTVVLIRANAFFISKQSKLLSGQIKVTYTICLKTFSGNFAFLPAIAVGDSNLSRHLPINSHSSSL